MATMAFNKSFQENVENLYYNTKVLMTYEEGRKWYDLYESIFYTKLRLDAKMFQDSTGRCCQLFLLEAAGCQPKTAFRW